MAINVDYTPSYAAVGQVALDAGRGEYGKWAAAQIYQQQALQQQADLQRQSIQAQTDRDFRLQDFQQQDQEAQAQRQVQALEQQYGPLDPGQTWSDKIAKVNRQSKLDDQDAEYTWQQVKRKESLAEAKEALRRNPDWSDEEKAQGIRAIEAEEANISPYVREKMRPSAQEEMQKDLVTLPNGDQIAKNSKGDWKVVSRGSKNGGGTDEYVKVLAAADAQDSAADALLQAGQIGPENAQAMKADAEKQRQDAQQKVLDRSIIRDGNGNSFIQGPKGLVPFTPPAEKLAAETRKEQLAAEKEYSDLYLKAASTLQRNSETPVTHDQIQAFMANLPQAKRLQAAMNPQAQSQPTQSFGAGTPMDAQSQPPPQNPGESNAAFTRRLWQDSQPQAPAPAAGFQAPPEQRQRDATRQQYFTWFNAQLAAGRDPGSGDEAFGKFQSAVRNAKPISTAQEFNDLKPGEMFEWNGQTGMKN